MITSFLAPSQVPLFNAILLLQQNNNMKKKNGYSKKRRQLKNWNIDMRDYKKTRGCAHWQDAYTRRRTANGNYIRTCYDEPLLEAKKERRKNLFEAFIIVRQTSPFLSLSVCVFFLMNSTISAFLLLLLLLLLLRKKKTKISQRRNV